MNRRLDIARLIGAVLCAYLVVLQSVVGGVATARHAASLANPFGVECQNSTVTENGSDARGSDAVMACCTLGCVPAAATVPHEPAASAFRYDPSPSPLRTLAERETPPADAGVRLLKRPRGPPSAG